jgi:hypothetical protein
MCLNTHAARTMVLARYESIIVDSYWPVDGYCPGGGLGPPTTR